MFGPVMIIQRLPLTCKNEYSHANSLTRHEKKCNARLTNCIAICACTIKKVVLGNQIAFSVEFLIHIFLSQKHGKNSTASLELKARHRNQVSLLTQVPTDLPLEHSKRITYELYGLV